MVITDKNHGIEAYPACPNAFVAVEDLLTAPVVLPSG